MSYDTSAAGGTDPDVYGVRLLASTSTIPESVWLEISRLTDDYWTPSTFLGLCMSRQPMLPDATGRERTVIEALEAGDYEPVLEMLRWLATDADEGAPRVADPER